VVQDDGFYRAFFRLQLEPELHLESFLERQTGQLGIATVEYSHHLAIAAGWIWAGEIGRPLHAEIESSAESRLIQDRTAQLSESCHGTGNQP